MHQLFLVTASASALMAWPKLVMNHVLILLQLRGQLRVAQKNQVGNRDLLDETPAKKAKTKVIYGMKKVVIIICIKMYLLRYRQRQVVRG